MSEVSGAPPSPAEDARLVAALLAVDPAGLGGVWLQGRPGPARDAWLATLRAGLPEGAPMVRVPLHAGDERLLGGLDLAATLAAGRPIAERGLLEAADGGIVMLAMAERLSSGTASRIGAALDTAEIVAERDGFSLRVPTRFAAVALDEGIGPDETPPPALTERLAFRLDLDALPPARALPSPSRGGPSRSEAEDRGGGPSGVAERMAPHPVPGLRPGDPSSARGRVGVEEARALLPRVEIPDPVMEAICAAALAFGIASLRASIQAIAVARASAALAGRDTAGMADAERAARLVLAPRATRLPDLGESEPAPVEPPPPSPDRKPGEEEDRDRTDSDQPLEDRVLAAIAAAIPAGLLADLKSGAAGRSRGPSRGGAGAQQRDKRRGRPAGTLRGEPRRGARLNLVETLRAAAPWQPLRRKDTGDGSRRVVVRKDDFRVTRFKRRTETTTIFVVDASGSAALNRLAEAKGAVELLLAECYVRRDRVALIAFRGTVAELVLPPTRSLPRAKRGLAALPGGGGTPLATAIETAARLAESIIRTGGSAVLVFLTDGRGNIARSGEPGRERAGEDARAAARLLREIPATTLFIDTSPRPAEAAAALAREMTARYLPMPHGGSARLADAVGREVAAAGRRT